MPVDPQVERFLRQAAKANLPPLETLPVAEARQQMLDASLMLGPGPDVAHVEDTAAAGPAGGIPLRIYRPERWSHSPAPAVVYFHGGGWVIGSVETHDAYCRTLAKASHCVVISVEYRLAPEHKFPAAVEDAYAAVAWTAENAAALNVAPGRIAVAGDSAGGNLAAVAALLARDRGGPPIAFQTLIYPVLDSDFSRPSYREFADGYMLNRAAMIWFWRHYVADESQTLHPHAAPLRSESLAGLPPALIVTAECDPLRDEGEVYARRLQESGVEAVHSCYEGMIHGFTRRLRLFDKASAALEEVAAALRQRLLA